MAPVRVLLIGHVSAAMAAADQLRQRHSSIELDVLSYGRAPADTPRPHDARLLDLPAARPHAIVRFLAGLRRRSYDVALVAQPRLEVSRARGALLGVALASGARRITALDVESRSQRDVPRPVAALDGAAFGAAQVVARVGALIAAPVLDRVAARAARPVAQIADGGPVAYLRTDLDLALSAAPAGGSVAHTEGILLALRRRGHDVTLWTTGDLAGMPESVPQAHLPALLKANVPWEIAELLSGLLQAARLWRAPERPTFIYQRYSLNNMAGVLLARRWAVPLVLEANNSEVTWREEWSALEFPALARATERLVLGAADRVAAVSENAAKDLRAAAHLDGRLRVVPNGVEVARFADARPAPLPFTGDTFTVAFSGLFYPWHGVRHLAEAFVLARAERPQLRLLLIGDGEDAPLTRSILEGSGAMGDVLMTGLVARGDVPGLLAAADALATPHVRNDGFIGSPIKVWEYMAAGRPIVATAVAQIQEALRHEETALVVAPDDPRALADALVRLCDDPALCERLGSAAQNEARESHSWDARLAAILRS